MPNLFATPFFIVAGVFALLGLLAPFRHLSGGFVMHKGVWVSALWLEAAAVSGIIGLMIEVPQQMTWGIALFSFALTSAINGLNVLTDWLVRKWFERRSKRLR